MADVPSTLKRPSEADLAKFRLSRIGDEHTVGSFLKAGFSLGIFCRDCPRMIEWTPPELKRRFGDRPGLLISKIAGSLACKGEGGCGSTNIAVGPHLYDGEWPEAG